MGMRITQHSSSTVIEYAVKEVNPFLSFQRAKNGNLTPVEVTAPKVLRIRRARNGTLRVSMNGSPVTKIGAVHTITTLPEDVTDALNATLDQYGVRDFSDAECQELLNALEGADEILCRAFAKGRELEAVRATMRVGHAQMPVYMDTLKPALSPHEHPLNDFFYDDAETIYATPLPFMHAADMREFAYQAYGFYRKDLIKLITQLDARSLTWVAWFKGGLTPDQTVRVLSHFKENPLGPYAMPRLEHKLARKIVQDVHHPTSLYNLVLGKRPLEFDQNHTLGEVWVDGAEEMNVKMNGWEPLYDRALRVSSERLKGFNASIPEDLSHLDGLRHQDYTVHVLHTPEDYYQTGKEMGVCIGQMRYMKLAHDGDALHIRFDQDNDMSALLDLRKTNDTTYAIQEFRGQKNAHVPDEEELLSLIANAMPYNLTHAS